MKKFVSAGLCACIALSCLSAASCSDKKDDTPVNYYKTSFTDINRIYYELQKEEGLLATGTVDKFRYGSLKSVIDLTDDGHAISRRTREVEETFYTTLLTIDGSFQVSKNITAKYLIDYDYNTDKMSYIPLLVRNPDYDKDFSAPDGGKYPETTEFYATEYASSQYLGTLDDGSYVFCEANLRRGADGQLTYPESRTVSLSSDERKAEEEAMLKLTEDRQDNGSCITVYDKNGILTSVSLIYDADKKLGLAQELGGVYQNSAKLVDGVVYVSFGELGGDLPKEE